MRYLGLGEQRGAEGLFLAQGPRGDVAGQHPGEQGQAAHQALWGWTLGLVETSDGQQLGIRGNIVLQTSVFAD